MPLSDHLSEHAVCFAHVYDGDLEALALAERHTGAGSRILTVPELVSMRMGTPIETGNDTPNVWSLNFLTGSTEFYGLSKDGKAIVAVLHGGGPVSDLSTIRERMGGGDLSVPCGVFEDVVAGRFGEVQLVDFDEYVRRLRVPSTGWEGILTATVQQDDVLLAARMGGRAMLDRYAKFVSHTLVGNTGDPHFFDPDSAPLELLEHDEAGLPWPSKELFREGVTFAHHLLLLNGWLSDSGKGYVDRIEFGMHCAEHTAGHEVCVPVTNNELTPDHLMPPVRAEAALYPELAGVWTDGEDEHAEMPHVFEFDFGGYSRFTTAGDPSWFDPQSWCPQYPVLAFEELGPVAAGWSSISSYDVSRPRGANCLAKDKRPLKEGRYIYARGEIDFTKRLKTPSEIYADPELYLQMVDIEVKRYFEGSGQ
jgi:hypothetical protein